MGDEAAAIGRSVAPVTARSLVGDVRALGDLDGRVVLVHTSLSALGWVAGGAPAVVATLVELVGPGGTLVVPTHSTFLSEPSRWQAPPVPEAWWPVFREEAPPYDPALTPTRRMGAVVECFRHLPGVRRSGHPALSFAAAGPEAAAIVDGHTLDDGMGERSPLARVYERDGLVLLLGVAHGNNTSLHLAEHRAEWPGKPRIEQGSPMLVDGERRWVTYEQLDYDDDGFAALGEDLPAQAVGRAGAGQARLMRQRDVVDFGVGWLSDARGRRAP